MENLEFTGERLTTSLDSVHGVIEHLHRYAIAQKIAKDKIILDIASGEGYGSYLLSQVADKVIGVDIDEKSINHATKKYASTKNLEFLVGSTDSIPIADNTVDIVISFETIEHHDKHELMMKEISRVLKKNGMMLISSPEKSIYAERDPNNPFHIKELTLIDFKDLLNRYFKNVILFNQRFVIGSLLHLENLDYKSKFDLYDGDYMCVRNELDLDDFYNKAYFNIALCSNVENYKHLDIGASIFNGVSVVKEEMKKEKTKYQEKYQEKYENIYNSKSYQIGNRIVKMLKFFRFWKK